MMTKITLVQTVQTALLSGALVALSACGGGDDNPSTTPAPTPTPALSYTVGGTVSGLTGTVILQNNGGNPNTLTANGAFAFAAALASGAGYAVTVTTQPTNPAQVCTVSGGSGVIASANVSNVLVECVTSPPTPVAQEFKVLPRKMALSVGDEGEVLSVAAPGAVTWSSSDAAVASVDAQGRVTGLAPGSAVVTATSGTAVASAVAKVFATNAATSSSLIDSALKQGTINAELALTYRVFALFADDRLPAGFDGPPNGAPDHMLMRRVSAALSTMSQATQDILAPFLVPPIYSQSGYAQVTAARADDLASGTRTKSQSVPINCEAAALPAFWKRLSTAHFNVFYLSLGDNLYDTFHRNSAEMIAAVAEEAYGAETELLQRFPLSDATEACNGGDGAVDIYLSELGNVYDAGLTQSYPNRCNNVPSYVVINSNHSAVRLVAAGRPEARGAVKAVVAHEFAHVLQLAMDRRGASCDDYEWLDEATAEWAMDFIDSAVNVEDGFIRAAPSYRRSGSFYAQYLYSDHMASIENPGGLGDPDRNGYADYIFFQYLAKKYDPPIIKSIFDATEMQASVEAVQTALASKGNMKKVWPEFALTLWNDAFNHVLDDFSRWDNYDYGLAPVFERRAAIGSQYPEAERLKTIEVDQKGQPKATFKLLKNALELPGEFPADNYEIQPRSLFYEHLKFTDPSVHSVFLFNPIAIYPNREFIKVQAKKKIGGQWQATEDWTQDPYKQFCRDKQDERLEELILIVSNSEVNRGSEQAYRIPKDLPLRLSTSNVGCWKWQGAASTAVTVSTPQPASDISSGVVEFEVTSILPGRIIFDAASGIVKGRTDGMLGDCTLTVVGADKTVVKNAIPPDGTLYISLDLDLGFSGIGGEVPDRKLVDLQGLSRLSATTTLACPTSTQVTTGSQSWGWLTLEDPSLYEVSTDGQTIEGRYSITTPTGAQVDSVWRFTSMRE